MVAYFSGVFKRPVLLIVTIFLCVLLFIFTWLTLRFFYVPITTGNRAIVFVIHPGKSIVKLVQDLHRRGILEDPYYFLLLAQLKGDLSKIKAGEYLLKPNTTPDALLKKLVKGDILLHKITFVEGWTFDQMMTAIAADSVLNHSLQTQDPMAIMASIGHREENPEGKFYPSTYFFPLGTKDTKILQMAYDLMQKKLQSAWKQRSMNVMYENPDAALIVASMIEKETADLKERPMIAGVILNRLKQNMKLQVDASVIYGLGKNFIPPLSGTDLKKDTPYNTYIHKGLPPTPIAMPSESSILAALKPQVHKDFYYVAKGDGTHVFSENFQAHQEAIKIYLTPRTVTVQHIHSP